LRKKCNQGEQSRDIILRLLQEKLWRTNRLKMPIYKPTLNQVDKLRYDMECNKDSSFKNVFDPNLNLTNHINEEMIRKCDMNVQENHNVICIYGLTGKGKSNSGISVAKKVFPDLKVNNICFHNQEILEVLKSARKPDWIIRDENLEGATFGGGAYRIKAQLEVVTQTLRKKCISFTFISAPFFPLDTAQYYFRALDMDKHNRITRFGVQDPMTLKYLGSYYVRVMSELDPFWIAYNQRKEEFMESLMSGDYTKAKPEILKLAQKAAEDMDLNLYQTKKERKVFLSQAYSSLTRGEIENLATLVEIMLRKTDEESDDDIEEMQP